MFFITQFLGFSILIGTFGLMYMAYRHLHRQPLSEKDLLIWSLIIFFMPIIGSILVFFYFDTPRAK